MQCSGRPPLSFSVRSAFCSVAAGPDIRVIKVRTKLFLQGELVKFKETIAFTKAAGTFLLTLVFKQSIFEDVIHKVAQFRMQLKGCQ
jgi:hypothetical protein